MIGGDYYRLTLRMIKVGADSILIYPHAPQLRPSYNTDWVKNVYTETFAK